MQVIKLTAEHQQQYSEFVASHPSGSFLQSWSWGEFQTNTGKGVVRYGVFKNDGARNLVATVQFLITKVPHLPGSYLYAPYGPLVSELENESEIISALLEQAKKDFSKAWFIRLEPKDELPIDGRPTVHIQPGSTLMTDISVSEDELLIGMHQKTRYNIKVAAKHDVVVSSSTATHSEAITLLSETSKRQGYKSHNNSYYIDMLSYFAKLPGNSDCKVLLYQATYNTQPIASAIMVDHGNTRTYLFGGSDDANKNVMAPYALHWQAIRDAKAIGLTSYDWWGTETATGKSAGFVQFKMRWGGVQKFYAGARDIVLNGTWYLTYSALRKVNRFL